MVTCTYSAAARSCNALPRGDLMHHNALHPTGLAFLRTISYISPIMLCAQFHIDLTSERMARLADCAKPEPFAP